MSSSQSNFDTFDANAAFQSSSSSTDAEMLSTPIPVLQEANTVTEQPKSTMENILDGSARFVNIVNSEALKFVAQTVDQASLTEKKLLAALSNTQQERDKAIQERDEAKAEVAKLNAILLEIQQVRLARREAKQQLEIEKSSQQPNPPLFNQQQITITLPTQETEQEHKSTASTPTHTSNANVTPSTPTAKSAEKPIADNLTSPTKNASRLAKLLNSAEKLKGNQKEINITQFVPSTPTNQSAGIGIRNIFTSKAPSQSINSLERSKTVISQTGSKASPKG